MRVRFLREWHGAKIGGLRDIGDGVANVLIRRGIAVYDPADVSVVENASLAPVETAVRRKRGRPRKVRV